MTRESEKSKIRMSVIVDGKHINSLKKTDEVIDQIFDEHEAQLKAKDEEIKELGEIVQQYLIPSKNYDAIIKAKDDEIERLKEQIKANDELIKVLECRAYHAEGYINDLHNNSKEQQ